jgi:hypothetical protein
MLNGRFGVLLSIILSLMLIPKTGIAQTSFLGPDNGSLKNHTQIQDSVFPQTKLAECNKQGAIYQSDDLSIIISGVDIVFKSPDSSLNTWTAQSSFNSPGCEIFQADLSGTGSRDLLILTPGIGSRGEYDTRLTIILFNTAGKPTPWTATGRFRVINGEIREIERSADGTALIQHNYSVGHPSWGGVTYISSLYKVINGEILSVNGQYSGVTFPNFSGAKANDTAFQKSIDASKRSTTIASQTPVAETQAPRAHFVRYGASTKISETQNSASLPTLQGPSIMIDEDALAAGREHIELSDGSKLDLPAILIIDSVSNARKIVFAPESTNMTQLKNGSYEIQQIGKDCQDVDDCRPFILHAVEQRP